MDAAAHHAIVHGSLRVAVILVLVVIIIAASCALYVERRYIRHSDDAPAKTIE